VIFYTSSNDNWMRLQTEYPNFWANGSSDEAKSLQKSWMTTGTSGFWQMAMKKPDVMTENGQLQQQETYNFYWQKSG
jgi:hypothetical protein